MLVRRPLARAQLQRALEVGVEVAREPAAARCTALRGGCGRRRVVEDAAHVRRERGTSRTRNAASRDLTVPRSMGSRTMAK